jgi:hypothetical protein
MRTCEKQRESEHGKIVEKVVKRQRVLETFQMIENVGKINL